MNVLILPHNMASMPALTAEALNEIEGVKAKCITIGQHKYQSLYPHTIYLPLAVSKRNPFKWLWHKITFKSRVKKLFKWADVFHYHWGSMFADNRDLEWVAGSGKPIFIEWVGSEIRIPDILKKINPFYAAVFDNGYEYKFLETKENSLRNQRNFKNFGAIPLVIPEMTLYVQKDMFLQTYPSQLRINLDKYSPSFPKNDNKRPLIIHSPSAKVAKGSECIIATIDALKKDYAFDFMLLHDMDREEVLSVMQKADIMIDQIIIGSYGMAVMEAMSFGKPVMCYIMPEVFEGGLSPECPVINTTPDTIKMNLAKLITDAQLRHDIGKKSRAFAEKFHDIRKVAADLVLAYRTEMNKEANHA